MRKSRNRHCFQRFAVLRLQRLHRLHPVCQIFSDESASANVLAGNPRYCVDPVLGEGKTTYLTYGYPYHDISCPRSKCIRIRWTSIHTTSTIGRGSTTHHAAWLFLHVNQCQRMCMSHMQYLCDVVDYVVVPCFSCSTVPHKAVADVSKIGNLQEELGCWVARAAEQAADGATGGWSVGCWSACSAHRMHDCWTYGLDWPGAPMHAAFTGCRATGFTQHG